LLSSLLENVILYFYDIYIGQGNLVVIIDVTFDVKKKYNKNTRNVSLIEPSMPDCNGQKNEIIKQGHIFLRFGLI